MLDTDTGTDTDILAEAGWRTEQVQQPDGSWGSMQVPLTDDEFLHPEHGFHLPNSTFHDKIAGDCKDILTRRYASDPHVAVFRDLNIQWGKANLGKHCPDTCVMFEVRDKNRNWTEFRVDREQARPVLVIEVVSPRYRNVDRQVKVREYAQAGVETYIIFDYRQQRDTWIEEVLGYQLVDGLYLPLVPDEAGQILAEAVGLWFGLEAGEVVVVDAATGETLPNSLALEQQKLESEQRVLESEQRVLESEQRAARLAELLRTQGIDPDQLG
jgi:Uma2 family endonuclease